MKYFVSNLQYRHIKQDNKKIHFPTWNLYNKLLNINDMMNESRVNQFFKHDLTSMFRKFPYITKRFMVHFIDNIYLYVHTNVDTTAISHITTLLSCQFDKYSWYVLLIKSIIMTTILSVDKSFINYIPLYILVRYKDDPELIHNVQHASLEVNNDVIEIFQDSLNWPYISQNREIDKEFIDRFHPYIDLDRLQNNISVDIRDLTYILKMYDIQWRVSSGKFDLFPIELHKSLVSLRNTALRPTSRNTSIDGDDREIEEIGEIGEIGNIDVDGEIVADRNENISANGVTNDRVNDRTDEGADDGVDEQKTNTSLDTLADDILSMIDDLQITDI